MSLIFSAFGGLTLFMINPKLTTIILQPIGEVKDTTIFHFLATELKRIFELPVQIKRPISLDTSAYNQERQQYFAPKILSALGGYEQTKNEIILGIVDVDLYVEGLNFIFGQADLVERKAIIATPRLRQEYYGQKPNIKLLQRRALTEAVHELGHIFGLNHCPNPNCVMFFSNTLRDTDTKGYKFCPICKRKIFLKDWN